MTEYQLATQVHTVVRVSLQTALEAARHSDEPTLEVLTALLAAMQTLHDLVTIREPDVCRAHPGDLACAPPVAQMPLDPSWDVR
jgi:hypothetical protein